METLRKIKTKVNRRILNTRFRNRYLALRDRLEKNKSIIVEHVDIKRRSVRMSVHLPSSLSGLRISTDTGSEISMDDIITCETKRGPRTYFWITFPKKRASVFMTYNGTPVKYIGNIAERAVGELTFNNCALRGHLKADIVSRFPPAVQMVRDAATSEAMKDRFADCWVLADRSDKADDNAEYFYRFVQSQPDAPKIFFLLDRNSPDWARLRDDGFNLIEFNSLEHLAAVVHARWSAPVEWSNLIVSAWLAFGLSERCFQALVGGIPERCAV